MKNIQVIYGTLNHLNSLNGYFEIIISRMMKVFICSQKYAFSKCFLVKLIIEKHRQAPKDLPLQQASERGNSWVWSHIMCHYSPESFVTCSAPESFPSYYVVRQWEIESLSTVKILFFSYCLKTCILNSFLLLILEGTEGYAFLFR